MEGFEALEDVFTVGELARDMDRWRPFLDLQAGGRIHPDWNPQMHNERVVETYRRQAKLCYEHALVLSILEDDGERTWECRPFYRYFKLIAEIEMRCSAIEICSFQLTANTVGIRTQAPHREDLYLACALGHATHLYLYDMVCNALRKKTGRGEIAAEKPSRTDTSTELARNLDKQIFSIHILATQALPRMKGSFSEENAEGLSRRMGMLVKALDKVLVVL